MGPELFLLPAVQLTSEKSQERLDNLHGTNSSSSGEREADGEGVQGQAGAGR